MRILAFLAVFMSGLFVHDAYAYEKGETVGSSWACAEKETILDIANVAMNAESAEEIGPVMVAYIQSGDCMVFGGVIPFRMVEKIASFTDFDGQSEVWSVRSGIIRGYIIVGVPGESV